MAEKPKDQNVPGIGASERKFKRSRKNNTFGTGSLRRFNTSDKLKEKAENANDSKQDVNHKLLHSTRKLAITRFAVKKRFTVTQKSQEKNIAPPPVITEFRIQEDDTPTRYVNFTNANKNREFIHHITEPDIVLSPSDRPAYRPAPIGRNNPTYRSTPIGCQNPVYRPAPDVHDGAKRAVYRMKQVKDTYKREIGRKQSYHFNAISTAKTFTSGLTSATRKLNETADPNGGYTEQNFGDEIGRKAQEYTTFSFQAANKIADIAAPDLKNRAVEEVSRFFQYKPKSGESVSYRPPTTTNLENIQLKADAAKLTGQSTLKSTTQQAISVVSKESGKQAAKQTAATASKNMAKQAMKKTAQQNAVRRAAASAAAKTSAKVAAATAGGAATGGVITVVMVAYEGVKWFAKPKNSAMFIMVFMFFLLLPIIALALLIQGAMYPFDYIASVITGDDGNPVVQVEQVDMPGQAIEYYLNLEKQLVTDEKAVIEEAKKDKGSSSKPPLKDGMSDAYDAAAARDGMNQWAYEDAVAGGYDNYNYTDPVTGASMMANTADGAPVFDDSSYRVPVLETDKDGNYMLSDEQKQDFKLNGGMPYVAPVFGGIRWKGTAPPEPFKSQWDNEEGKTDATELNPPNEIYQQMLSTLSADRQFMEEDEITDYLSPDLCTSFFNSLPLWKFNTWQESYSCEGCVHIEWSETVMVTSTHKDPETGKETTSAHEVTTFYEMTLCPSHIFNVLDIQLDSDPIENKPDEYYDIDRVWDKLWSTPLEGETEEDTEKRRKDGVEAYEDIIDEMGKDLKEYEKVKT